LPRERQHRDPAPLGIKRDLAERLDSVAEERHAALPADGAQVCHRIDGADLVVDGHDRHQDRVGGDCRAEVRRRDQAITIDRQVGHVEPDPLEELHRVENRRMLDRGGDQVLALAEVAERDPLDRQVVRLRPAPGEGHLFRRDAQDAGDLLTGSVDVAVRLLAGVVARARVAERALVDRSLREQARDLVAQIGGGVVIEVNLAGVLDLDVCHRLAAARGGHDRDADPDVDRVDAVREEPFDLVA
jgi:hypothetical protein